MKSSNMTILICCLLVCCGCTSEFNLATGREESLFYTTEQEVRIGEKVSKQFDKHYEISTEVEENKRVNRILDKIVAVCDRKEFVYTIKIIDDDKLNALSLPGGPVYVFKKLVDKVNDDELAGIIAHEVAHIAARHGVKRMQGALGYTLVQALAVSTGNTDAILGAQAAYLTAFLAYSREDEFQADRLGVKYMKKAGYDPSGMVNLLEKLMEEKRRAPLQKFGYWRTHPYLNERMAVVRQAITGQLDFKGYLNLTGNER